MITYSDCCAWSCPSPHATPHMAWRTVTPLLLLWPSLWPRRRPRLVYCPRAVWCRQCRCGDKAYITNTEGAEILEYSLPDMKLVRTAVRTARYNVPCHACAACAEGGGRWCWPLAAGLPGADGSIA